MKAEEREFQAVCYAQFVVYLAQIIFDNLLGGTYAQRDFLVLHALGHAGDDERFLRSQLHFGAR